jgi:hypothetical protein
MRMMGKFKFGGRIGSRSFLPHAPGNGGQYVPPATGSKRELALKIDGLRIVAHRLLIPALN